jgi:hypothetical protein
MSTPTVSRLQTRLDSAWREACGKQSLADLVETDRAGEAESKSA